MRDFFLDYNLSSDFFYRITYMKAGKKNTANTLLARGAIIIYTGNQYSNILDSNNKGAVGPKSSRLA